MPTCIYQLLSSSVGIMAKRRRDGSSSLSLSTLFNHVSGTSSISSMVLGVLGQTGTSIIPFSLQSGGDSAFPMLLISILLHSLLLTFKFFQQLCKNYCLKFLLFKYSDFYNTAWGQLKSRVQKKDQKIKLKKYTGAKYLLC